MKTNKMMRIASVLLVAVLLTTCVISGTFAKYTSTAKGTATVTVAKWAFKVNTTDVASADNSKTFAFDLFDTILDTKDDADEEDVVDDKIAPGTKGSFALQLENVSDVTAKYTISLAYVGEPAVKDLIKYSTEASGEYKTADQFTVTSADIEAGAAAETVTIYWQWAFDGADAADTAAGIAAETVTVNATIAVEQVD